MNFKRILGAFRSTPVRSFTPIRSFTPVRSFAPIRSFSLFLVLVLPLTALLALSSHASPNMQTSPDLVWKKCLPLDSSDRTVGALGGTEARVLVSMDQHLYAGIGYWMDSEEGNPKLPGAQILRLDSPGGEWKVDLQLDEFLKGKRANIKRYMAVAIMKSVKFETDSSGNKLAHPAEFLLAGFWDKLGQLQVFSKQSGANQWNAASLGHESGRYAEIRSFGSHRDAVNKIQRVFAGTRTNGAAVEPQIFSGVYDAHAPSGIRWDDAPEKWQGDLSNLARTTKASARITAFAECSGKLYATVYNVLYERQDGDTPSWKPVWRYDPAVPFGNGASGFRGLTAIQSPTGAGQVLLVSVENKPGQIFRFDPATGSSVEELNVTQYMTGQLSTKVGYTDAGYNDMLPYETADESELLLMGLELATPQLPGNFFSFNPDALYLIRRADGKYSYAEIVDRTLKPKPALVAVRSMINSPFPQDPPGTVYAAGFDANGNAVHNTAWIYRGVPVNAAHYGTR